MQALEAFSDLQLVFAGKTFSWYRGIRRSDGQTRLLKTTSSDYPRHSNLLFLERDFAIAERLPAEAVLQPEQFLRTQNRLYIVLPDFPGMPLQQYLREHNSLYLDPVSAIQVLTAMVRAVGVLHKNKLIHRGLNPTSIFLQPATADVRITGFGFSTFTDSESQDIELERYETEDWLAYISPEQTGRMSADVDQRSDFYALGILFFECLTRQLPFPYSDTMGLIHSHIAQEPPQIRTLNPAIPASLAEVVHKLIAKNGRDRYQSARGILADLQKCLNLVQAGRIGATFPLGEADISEVLYLPERSFGRETELAQLCEIFEHPEEDRLSAVFISGPSGIGKSTLVQAAKAQSAARKDFYFLSGTYKNYNKNIPLVGITGALTGHVEQILTAPKEIILDWRRHLLETVGNQGRLLTELIPELELLLGEQPPLDADLTPDEAQNRLKNTLLNFIQALIRPGRRLVLFLDDLHLADAPSLAFLRTMAQHLAGQNLLLIGAFVEDAPDNDETLSGLLENFRREATTTEVELKPLPADNLRQLVAETLHASDDSSAEITGLIHAKTRGIPIFILEFLQRAQRSGALFFDENAHRWQWDFSALENLPIADNVADLMLGKVQQLPEESRELLKLAACIGARFDLSTLAALHRQTPEHTFAVLTEALLSGTIVADTSWSQNSGGVGGSVPNWLTLPEKSFAFAHDRLHQALYSLVGEAKKTETHGLIAEHQLNHFKPHELEKQLFEVANHIHLGLEIIRQEHLTDKAIPVLSASGIKAKHSSSYPLAFTYLSDAMSLLTPEYRTENPGSAFEMGLELVECAFLAGETERGEEVFLALLGSAESTLDKARVLQVKAMSQLHLSNFPEAYRICRESLGLFGIQLPDKPGQHHVLLEIIKTKVALRGKTREVILDLPLLTDPAALLIEALYQRCLSHAMSTSKELFAIISLRMLRNTLRYGIGPFAYSGINLYGQILTLGFGQYRKGFDYVELGLHVAQKIGTPGSIGGAQFGVAMTGVHTLPLPLCTRNFEEAHDKLHQGGNIYYASTATSNLILYYILLGKSLEFVRGKAQHFQRYAHNANQPDTDEFQDCCLTFVDVLSGAVPGPSPDPSVKLAHYRNFSDIHTAWYYILDMNAAYLLDAPGRGLQTAAAAERSIDAVFFHIMYPEYFFYRSLLQAQAYDTVDKRRKSVFRKEIGRAARLFQKRAGNAPENYRHKQLILRGIYYQLDGQVQMATADFEQAIALTSGEDYIQIAAIAHELAGRLYHKQGQGKQAADHLERAYRSYEKWGARAVCVRLLRDYPESLSALKGPKKVDGFTTSGGGSIDLKSVMKAYQVLSSEIELSKVLTNLIRITIENAGAQRGYLLIETPSGWVIEATGATEQQDVQTRTGIPVAEGSAELAMSVVNYVAHTRKAVVLEDAVQDQRFSHDPYVAEKRPRSIACYPVINQGKLMGILYMENNLAAGAFTPDRAEVLELLSGQAGISLQNAYLYAQKLELNKAYERFVPKEFLNFLNKESITEVQLGDHVQQEMTVMFADIRSFTTISERLSPRDNFRFINDYLGLMEPVIRKYHGFVDKYIGDAIMALFPTRADDALQAALEMIDQLEEFNRRQGLEVRIGVGLNTGNLILGIVGGQDRMESTVISDAVNIAARVESMTKRYGVNLLISENTHSRLDNPSGYPIRLLDRVVPDGKTEPIAVYEVITGEGEEIIRYKLSTLATFQEGQACYWRADYSRAAKLFRQITAENPGDKPARLFLDNTLDKLGKLGFG